MTSRLDQASLFDVSEEDDSLLPTGNKVTLSNPDDLQRSSSVPGHMGCTAEPVAAIQKDFSLCQPVCVGIPEEPENLALPVLTEEPALVKKKKKTGFNVRKSLAWNNAFFTEEGVLDSEELSLVNRTFQKPLGLPKPSIFKKPTPASKILKPPMMPKISLTSHTMALTTERKENLIIPAISSPRRSTDSINGSVSKSSEKHFNNIKGLNTRHGAIPLANVQHRDTSQKEKAMIPAHADSSESKQLLLRRSLDKKDQGLSLPGVNRYNEEDRFSVVKAGLGVTASNSVTGKRATHIKHVVKEGRLISQSANTESSRCTSLMKSTGERLSSTSVPRAQQVPTSMRLPSETASTKIHPTVKRSSPLEGSGGSGAFANRDKPSGLRMPSPKLGFFDTGKTATQVAVLRERTNGHGYGGPGVGRSNMADNLDAEISNSRSTTNQIHGLKHPAVSTKSGHQLLEASSNQTKGVKSSTSIPVAPHVHGCSAEVTSMRAAPAHESLRSASYLSNRKNDSREQVLQARKIVQNTSTWGKPVRSKPAPSAARNVLGQENLSPNRKEGKDTLQKCTVAQGFALGNPNIKAFGKTCAVEVKVCEKRAQNAVSPAQDSVSHYLSSTSHNLLGQQYAQESIDEVLVSQSLDSAETDRAGVSQTGEEWPQGKRGVVQNSPPDKESPKHGPWSPVRRTIEQLGPFDCTKLANTGVL